MIILSNLVNLKYDFPQDPEYDQLEVETAVGYLQIANKMPENNFTDFIYHLTVEKRKLFKQYERNSYKIINTTHSIKFNNDKLP